MSLEIFERLTFRTNTLSLIDLANAIISEYELLGFILTLRQLFYQFVSRGQIENTQRAYKRLGGLVKNGRRAGLIDWDAIEDRTRFVRRSPSWANPAEIISAGSHQYREDLWRTQGIRLEIWIEKDALLGVVEGVCEGFRLPYFSCRGNVSDSEIYSAAKRFQRHLGSGQRPLVLHLGDHDPSGIDMTRDVSDRLALFAGQSVEVRRLALNMDQIERYRPPPNPAKETDTRFRAYAKKYGTASWELDALDPTIIADLIRTQVEKLIDAQAWDAAEGLEAENRALLEAASNNWALVENMLTEGGR
jgi:hypothetical protein